MVNKPLQVVNDYSWNAHNTVYMWHWEAEKGEKHANRQYGEEKGDNMQE